jgi:hypothetical protein
MEVINRCLAKEPEERFGDGADLAAHLVEVQNLLARFGPVEPLGEYVLRRLPQLFEQVTSTQLEVESVASSFEHEIDLDAPTIIQPAPFEERAGDLEDTPSYEEPAPQPDLDATPNVDEEDLEAEEEGSGSRLAMRVALTVVIGVVAGVGFAYLVWHLGLL